MTLLSVSDLHVEFPAYDLRNNLRIARALDGVSFECAPGEILGLVGETGAGKSLTAQAVMATLRAPGRLSGGSIVFEGRSLVGLSEPQLAEIRGNKVSLVVQNAKSSLDPKMRVGDQMVRLYRNHRSGSREAARKRALEMMERVAIPHPARRFDAWPHELSGGMAQRICIAMALMTQPSLLIADEPTTGLDVTVQRQIMELIASLVREDQMGALLITHDLGVVAHYCTRMAVMFGGRIMEIGPVDAIFARPAHPYTRALLASSPDWPGAATFTPPASRRPPDLFNRPPGCPYQDRCERSGSDCRADFPERIVEGNRRVGCVRPIIESEVRYG